MTEIQQGNQYFLLNIEPPFDNKSDLFSPQFWQAQGRILGQAKGRGITYFLNTQELWGVNAALRHYYRGGLWGKINRDRYTWQGAQATRSFQEFKLLQDLHQAGLPVPKPLAARAVKGRLGVCYQADILLEKIDNAEDLTVYLVNSSLNTESWQQIGKLIRQMHDLQVCHTDLNAHNILLEKHSHKFWLLDFDKCGYKQGNDWKQANLARLKRSFLKEKTRLNIHFDEENWAALVEGYQG